MNVITVKPSDFLNPNSPENKKAISKQIKLIRELYSLFPYAVVAGGLPVNHLVGVPGRDIDIFVTSETEAEQIVQHFTQGLTPEQSRIEQYALTNDNSKYLNNWNSHCWKFFGASQLPRNTGLFDMNVIVRRVPAETEVQHRIQLLPMLWATFPIARFATAYMDWNGLCIMTAAGGTVEGTPEYAQKMFDKSLLFYLAYIKASGKSGGKTMEVVRNFHSDIQNVKPQVHGRPETSILNELFTRTADLTYQLYRDVYRISDRNNVLETRVPFTPTVLWGRCATETQLVQMLTGERSVTDVHQEIEAEGRATRKKQAAKDHGYLSDMSWYDQYQRSSAGSRSQQWLDTWGIAPAVQPSGGSGAVVDSTSTPFSWGEAVATIRSQSVIWNTSSAYQISGASASRPAPPPPSFAWVVNEDRIQRITGTYQPL